MVVLKLSRLKSPKKHCFNLEDNLVSLFFALEYEGFAIRAQRL